MNKDQLVDAVTEQVGDRRTAAVAVEAVLVTVQRAVSAGDKVSLFGFGVFEKADRAARSARNPATGAPVSVAATSVPRFRAGQSFKDVVSGAKPAPELAPVTGAPLAVVPRRTTARAESAAPVEVTEAGREAAAEAVPADVAAPDRSSGRKPAVQAAARTSSTAAGRKAVATKAPAKKAAAKKSDTKAAAKKSDTKAAAKKSDTKAAAKKSDTKASAKKADSKKADAKKKTAKGKGR